MRVPALRRRTAAPQRHRNGRVDPRPGRRRRRHARGQAMVEFALIGPLAFLLLIGTVI
ncbi:MAG TPA: TadE/TadG family type IV pilus assembly protein, partial [Candidatus Dormibacteraeota bacterium]